MNDSSLNENQMKHIEQQNWFGIPHSVIISRSFMLWLRTVYLGCKYMGIQDHKDVENDG